MLHLIVLHVVVLHGIARLREGQGAKQHDGGQQFYKHAFHRHVSS
jgi:hypothetical protein